MFMILGSLSHDPSFIIPYLTFRGLAMSKRKPIKTLDLFAGGGGSSAGAKAAGAQVLAAVDCWSLAKKTYTDNFPEVRFLGQKCEDVRLGDLKKQIGEIDLIVASPECTSHTCAKGNAPRSEKSRQTAFQVVRFARALKPRWIVVENVVHMRSWKKYKSWIQEIRNLGYAVTEQVINAADHGVPQSRRRLFIMCDLQRTPATVKPTTRSRKSAASIVDKNGHFAFTPLRKKNRAAATIKRANRAIRKLGQKKPFLLVYYGSDAAGGWQRPSKPLRTLTTVDRFGYVRPKRRGHEMRMLQVPEIKAAMGFESSHKLERGTRREKIKLLGNAVCPPVMTAAIKRLTRRA
jgi:DNA (cytosine-5)-methyltransferase 1